MAAAVEVDDLVVRYGDVTAVRGVGFVAQAGQVTALLGPNGAGKTTTVETVEGYRSPSSGRVRVLGLDPIANHAEVSRRIGVMLQTGGVYPAMGPEQAIRLFASYYDCPLEPSALLDQVGLSGVARTPWRRLSGGEQQRLSLALALVGRPSVAFLDEPTAGVDPAGRLLIRDVIRALRDSGAAVLLTTHELEEASRLADAVVIVDRGQVVARGTPAELMASGGGSDIRFGAPPGIDVRDLAGRVGAQVTEVQPGDYRVEGSSSPGRVAALTTWLAEHDLPLADLRAERQTLEDVFLRLTGTSTSELERTPRERGRGRGSGAGAGSPGGRAAVGSPGGQRADAGSPGGGGLEGRPGRAEGQRRPRWSGRAVVAQTRAEATMTLHRGESLLLTLGIPVILLGFFSLIGYPDKAVTGDSDTITFLAPGILALAVMSTGMVSLGIATGFERQYGVLKRLGSTPLGRPALLAAKTAAIGVVELLQLIVLVAAGVALGWQPRGNVLVALAVIILATAAFAGIGLLMAGTLRAELTLAGANGLYLVLLLLGGMVVPLPRLPGPLQTLARALPAASLSDALHATLGTGGAVPGRAWVVLVTWAVVAPAAAALSFRWE